MITKLSEIDFLRDYPTIDPQGLHRMNVNGLAGCVELYFELCTLQTPQGSLVPVA